jgi:hypothetical protein
LLFASRGQVIHRTRAGEFTDGAVILDFQEMDLIWWRLKPPRNVDMLRL